MPSTATTGHSEQASVGVGPRTARPLAFDSPAQSYHCEPAIGVRQPAGQRMGGVSERSQTVQKSKYGMLSVARTASAERAVGAALASLLVGPSLEQSETDSAERLPKRQRLPVTPPERGRSPSRPAQGDASLFSAKLPPRWKRNNRLSDRLVPASPDGAVPSPPAAAMSLSGRSRPAGQPSPWAGPKTSSVDSPPSACAGRASAEGRTACNLSERQVVPETPARSSPSGGTAATLSRCEARVPSKPRLDAHMDGDGAETHRSPRKQSHAGRADALRPAITGPEMLRCATGSLAEQHDSPAGNLQAAVAAQLGAIQLHPDDDSPPAEPAGPQWACRYGGDVDLPDAGPVVPETEMDPLCPARLPTDGLPLLYSPVADAPPVAFEGAADPSPPAGLPLLSVPSAESPPSPLGSVVPGTQSPVESPSDPPHSKRRKSTTAQWRRQSCSEPLDQDALDRDRDIVPETLPWDVGCSEEAVAEDAALLQQTKCEQVMACSGSAAAATRQPAEGDCTTAVQKQGEAAPAAAGQLLADGRVRAVDAVRSRCLVFTVQLGKPIRCALSSPDGRYPASP